MLVSTIVPINAYPQSLLPQPIHNALAVQNIKLRRLYNLLIYKDSAA